jgi:hypothetical protein
MIEISDFALHTFAIAERDTLMQRSVHICTVYQVFNPNFLQYFIRMLAVAPLMRL